MAIYMEANTSISYLAGYSLLSETRIGSNGNYGDAPEYDIGTGTGSTDDFITGSILWDGEVQDGIDSNNRPFLFDARTDTADGNAEMGYSVYGEIAGPLTYAGASYGDISYLKIRAAAQDSGMEATWN